MKFSRDELAGALNALNEVCRGLPKRGPVAEYVNAGRFPVELESRLSEAYDAGEYPAGIAVSAPDAQALAQAIDIVLAEIDDPELHPRVGLCRDELTALRRRIGGET